MKFLIAFITLFIFCACGTQRQYFSPENAPKLETKSNPNIKKLSKNTILNNNYIILDDNIITKDKIIPNFNIEKDYDLLAIIDEEYIIADKHGNLKILNNNKEEIFNHKFNKEVLNIAFRGDDMALILADNTIMLFNRSLGVKFSQTLSMAIANDSRIAAPIFTLDSVFYPSLDGRLIEVDRFSGEVLKDTIIGTEFYFNNIIYFNIIKDKKIIATSKSIKSIQNDDIKSLDYEIKDILNTDEYIFILTKDGNIIKTDLNLNILTQKKLNFAIFTKSIIHNNELYIYEKTGYAIKSDLNLKNIKVFEFKDIKNAKIFLSNDKIFYKK